MLLFNMYDGQKNKFHPFLAIFFIFTVFHLKFSIEIRQLYRIPSRSVSPYGCITHMLSQMADTSRLYNSSGVADLICYPRWLIAVDYITHQV